MKSALVTGLILALVFAPMEAQAQRGGGRGGFGGGGFRWWSRRRRIWRGRRRRELVAADLAGGSRGGGGSAGGSGASCRWQQLGGRPRRDGRRHGAVIGRSSRCGFGGHPGALRISPIGRRITATGITATGAATGDMPARIVPGAGMAMAAAGAGAAGAGAAWALAWAWPAVWPRPD